MVASVISELIKVIYRFFFANYQQSVEGKKMKGSDSIFDYLDKIHYSCYKIYIQTYGSNCGGSYNDSPKWLKTNYHRRKN